MGEKNMEIRVASSKETERDFSLNEIEEGIKKSINDTIEIIKKSSELSGEISKVINEIVNGLKNGKKIIIFGNGGSAADAQHIAAEFIGRFGIERKSYPAIALTTDSSIITSLANDYSYDIVFSRQCESLVLKGDIIIGISTSGNSKNVEKGLQTAKKNGGITIGLLGNKGGRIKDLVDYSIIVDSKLTPKIQEMHRIIYHIICENVELELTK